MAVMAFTSSCKGYFSKKLAGLPVSPPLEAVYDTPSNQNLLKRRGELETELGRGAAVIASAYIMTQRFPSVPISSFSSVSQMEEVIAAGDFVLPEEIADEIRRSRKYIV
jgi:aryl-alcohol dehydrogenase-like predicted oxidoreductase